MKLSLTFSDGVSLGPGDCRVIVDLTSDFAAMEGTSNSIVLGWPKEWTALEIGHPLTRIARSQDNNSRSSWLVD